MYNFGRLAFSKTNFEDKENDFMDVQQSFFSTQLYYGMFLRLDNLRSIQEGLFGFLK